MLCCKLNRRERGSDIFLINAQNVDAGESPGGSHTWLFSQQFILCSDVNIMKLSPVMLVTPRVSLLQTLQRIIEYEEN